MDIKLDIFLAIKKGNGWKGGGGDVVIIVLSCIFLKNKKV